MGDFWGVPPEIRAKFAHTDAGISGVLTRTKKGESFFSAVQKNLQVAESDFWSAANGNPVINRPVDLHPLRAEYRCDFLRMNFDEFCQKWDGDFCKYIFVKERLDKYKEEIQLQNAEIAAIKSNFSYRIGRKVTWLPRKIRGTMRWLKTRGLSATVRHATGYVLRKIGVLK